MYKTLSIDCEVTVRVATHESDVNRSSNDAPVLPEKELPPTMTGDDGGDELHSEIERWENEGGAIQKFFASGNHQVFNSR